MFSEKFRVSQLAPPKISKCQTVFRKKLKYPDWPPHRISKYRNCTAVAVAVFLYLEILGGGGASPDTLTFSEKTITYRLTLGTFLGGPVGILYFFSEVNILKG